MVVLHSVLVNPYVGLAINCKQKRGRRRRAATRPRLCSFLRHKARRRRLASRRRRLLCLFWRRLLLRQQRGAFVFFRGFQPSTPHARHPCPPLPDCPTQTYFLLPRWPCPLLPHRWEQIDSLHTLRALPRSRRSHALLVLLNVSVILPRLKSLKPVRVAELARTSVVVINYDDFDAVRPKRRRPPKAHRFWLYSCWYGCRQIRDA